MNKTRQWMYLDDIELTIDGLISKYKELQLKAMDEDNVDKVNQFTGSMIALGCLKPMLGIIEAQPEEEC